MKKKRALLVSCSVILLCMSLIVGMTYALFTDSVSVGNHLKAGNLDVTLTRTNLEYSVLNKDGEFETETVTATEDFSKITGENVFGIDSKDIQIVPGSYFDAEMQIAHGENSNVAFNYSVTVSLISSANDLTDQLQVTITHSDGTKTVKKLSELASGLSISAGKMKSGAAPETFSIRVDFIDDVEYNKDLAAGEAAMSNNKAQGQTAVFDLVVTATQATA